MNKQIRLLAEQATTIEYGVDNGFDRVNFDATCFPGAEAVTFNPFPVVLFQKTEEPV